MPVRFLLACGVLTLVTTLPALAGPSYSSTSTFYNGRGPVATSSRDIQWNRSGGVATRDSSASFTNLKNGNTWESEANRTITRTPGEGFTVERSRTITGPQGNSRTWERERSYPR